MKRTLLILGTVINLALWGDVLGTARSSGISLDVLSQDEELVVPPGTSLTLDCSPLYFTNGATTVSLSVEGRKVVDQSAETEGYGWTFSGEEAIVELTDGLSTFRRVVVQYPSDGSSNRLVSVAARQRIPWNELVDVTYTVEGSVRATNAAIRLCLVQGACTNWLEGVSGDLEAGAGIHRVACDLSGRSLGNNEIFVLLERSSSQEILSSICGIVDLKDAASSVRVVDQLPFSLDVDLDPGYGAGTGARVLVNGKKIYESDEAATINWTATEAGTYVLVHQTLDGGVVLSEDAKISYEVWSDNIVLNRMDFPLNELLPTTYSNVVRVTVAEGATNICAGAFEGCSKLQAVVIPGSVITIGTNAFAGCSNLTEVECPAVGCLSNVFSGVYGQIVSVTVSEGTTSLPEDFFNGCVSLKSVSYPSTMDATAPLEKPKAGLDQVFVGWYVGDVRVRTVSDLLAAGGHAEARWDRCVSPWLMKDGAFNGVVANVYDGYVSDRNGLVVGTIQVKTAKQAVKTLTDKVTKEVSLVTNVAATAVVTAGGKKWSYSKGAVDWRRAGMGAVAVTNLFCTTKDVPISVFEVELGANGLSGNWGDYKIHGARNGMGVKGDAMMADLETFKGSWSVTVSDLRLQLVVGAKGGVKLAGTTVDGFKISANAQGEMDDGHLFIPYVATLKNGKRIKEVSFLLRLDRNGSIVLISGTEAGEDFDLVDGGRTEAPVLQDRTDARTIYVGVAFEDVLALQERGYPAKFAASKLPTGLKLNAATGDISGVPTKAGVFESVLKATGSVNAKWVDQVIRTYTVVAMPSWAVGTFNGGSDEGQVTLTVANTGKISGKWMSQGTNWTISATGFTSYEDGVYSAELIGKSGKSAFTNVVELTEDPKMPGRGIVTSASWIAYQNLWKLEPWKTIGKTLANKTVETSAGGGLLALKFAASGTVSVKGAFGFVMVNGSAVAVPCADGDYDVFVYLPPKIGVFSGFAGCVTVTP